MMNIIPKLGHVAGGQCALLIVFDYCFLEILLEVFDEMKSLHFCSYGERMPKMSLKVPAVPLVKFIGFKFTGC